MSEDCSSAVDLLEIEIGRAAQRRIVGIGDQLLDVVVVGDQRGQRLVAAHVAAQRRDRQPQRRLAARRRLVEIGAGRAARRRNRR